MRCVNTRFTSSPQAPVEGRQLKATSKIDLNALNLFLAVFTVTSHTGNLNIYLGGGGFNCIAFYSVRDVGEQISRSNPSKFNRKISLPPPFPSTINRGTGSFEGIEGTVDIATICGTTGPIIDVDVVKKLARLYARHLGPKKGRYMIYENKLRLIVQTISINSNMHLPVAP